MSERNRFVYVDTLPGGAQRLRLAELRRVLSLNRPSNSSSGYDLQELARRDGSSEFYRHICATPSNRYVAARSLQHGSGFVDHNIEIYDLRSGTLSQSFNEHRFAGTGRANCTSPVFEQLLVDSAAAGASESELAGYDYSVVVEGIVDEPTLYWTTNETLMVVFDLAMVCQAFGGSFTLTDQFRFEVDPSGTGPLPLSCNATPAPARAPSRSSLQIGGNVLLDPWPDIIHLCAGKSTFLRRFGGHIRPGPSKRVCGPLPFITTNPFLRKSSLFKSGRFRRARMVTGNPTVR